MYSSGRYVLMRTKTGSISCCMGTYRDQYGGCGHNVAKGGKDREQHSLLSEDKYVTLPGVKPVEGSNELSNKQIAPFKDYTEHNNAKG